MKKALSVTIGGIVFTIEEDAFHLLDEYLKDIRKFFSKNEDHEEIIADIEAGIADKFKQVLHNGKQAIAKKDVDLAIEQMGTINDFKEDENEKENDDSESVKTFIEKRIKGKKLFRDTDNKVLGGVCSGLGNYFGIDPTLVRIVFVVLMFTPLVAFAIVGYFIMMIITPEAKTRIDRMKMSGEEITLSSFSNEEKTEELKEKNSSILGDLFVFPFKILGKIFEAIGKIFPILINIIVGFTIFGIVMATVAFSIVTGIFVFFRDQFMIEAPFRFPVIATDYMFVGFVYFSVILTFIYLIILGVSIIKRRYIINGWMTAGLAAIWILAISGCGVLGVGTGLRIRQEYTNRPIEKKIIIPDLQFSSLTMDRGIDGFEVIYGPQQKITIEGVNTDLERITAVVSEKGDLSIKKELSKKQCIFCGNHGDIKVSIETPTFLSSASVNAPIHGDIDGRIMAPESIYTLDNNAHLTVNEINGYKIQSILKDGAKLTLGGRIDTITANIFENSLLEAQSLISQNADINVVEDGKAYLNSIQTIKGNTGEDGEIHYLNSPVIKASSSANIKQMIEGEIAAE